MVRTSSQPDPSQIAQTAVTFTEFSFGSSPVSGYAAFVGGDMGVTFQLSRGPGCFPAFLIFQAAARSFELPLCPSPAGLVNMTTWPADSPRRDFVRVGGLPGGG
jgi:hypothetical protein